MNIICITLKVSIAALYINTHSLSYHISSLILTKQNKVHKILALIFSATGTYKNSFENKIIQIFTV